MSIHLQMLTSFKKLLLIFFVQQNSVAYINANPVYANKRADA